MRILGALVFCAVGLSGESDSGVGADARWQPSKEFLQDLHTRCDSQQGASFGNCFVQQMQQAGASAAAVTFAHQIGNEGYLQEFRPVGKVDVAFVEFPFRANENHGWLLVNGSPAVVSVDDLQKLPQADMKGDQRYGAVMSGLSKATLFPGRRSSTDGPTAILMPDGSQQFVVDYRVLDGCHACSLLGFAFFGFNFDANGKYQGSQYLRFARPSLEDTTTVRPQAQSQDKAQNDAQRAKEGTPGQIVPEHPILMKAGQTFTLVLPSNKSTGYFWRLVNTPDPKVVKMVKSEYRAPSGRMGENGIELWTFQAVNAGSGDLKMNYVRQVGNQQEAAKNLDYVLYVQ